MQTREIDSSECMLARTQTGDELGTTLGTEGPYMIETVLLDGRIVSGYGIMFVPLGISRPEPSGDSWTKIIVSSGAYAGNYGYVRISEDSYDQESTKGLLATH